MKRFRITTAATTLALGLALTLLPTGAFAGDTQTAPPVTSEGRAATSAESEEEVEPILDLVFGIDTSAGMQGHMPTVKAAIQSLIRRERARYPGYTMRIGLVRRGDFSSVLDLSEDQSRFLEAVQDPPCDPQAAADVFRDYTGFKGHISGNFLGDARGMDWSPWFKKNRARRMYVIGTGMCGWSKNDDKAARKMNLIVSTAFCGIRPFGDPRAGDEENVARWVSADDWMRFSWIRLAEWNGGEFIQLFSHKDGTSATGRPLLGGMWEPKMAYAFNNYLALLDRLNHMTFDQYLRTDYGSNGRNRPAMLSFHRIERDADLPKQHWPGNEASVIRYFEQHPAQSIYLLRP
jgi:hypothetical protein